MSLLTRLGLFLAEGGLGGIEGGSGDDASAQTFLENLLNDYIYGTEVQAILGVALVLFLIIKGVMVGMKIVKAADDTSARKEAIDSLKYMIIGVAIVAVLYYGSGAIVGLFF